MARIKQSKPDSGVDFQVQALKDNQVVPSESQHALKDNQVVPSSLGSGTPVMDAV